MNKFYFFGFCGLFVLPLWSQQEITLEDCYQKLYQNYPLVQQKNLLAKQNKVNLKVIGTEKLPQFNFSAQATYQSDVIGIPIPGKEPVNKDQYKATLSIHQLIFDSGTINTALKASAANEKTQQKQVETSLHQLKLQVNQLYFSVLLLQEKMNLLNLQKERISSTLAEIKSGIKNGTILPASDLILAVELLKLEQKNADLVAQKLSFTQTLTSFIGKEISTNTLFQTPLVSANFTAAIQRPELELLQLKKTQIDIANELLSKQNSPKVLGFANLGYGNPGLNMLDNGFQPYYIVGLQLNWNPFDWNATKLKKESSMLKSAVFSNEMDIFRLNTNSELQQLKNEIDKTVSLILSDKEIILLRKEIVKSVASQLKNGLITPSTYTSELNNLNESEIALQTHEIELLLKTENYNLLKNN